jgi:hypothetical protein
MLPDDFHSLSARKTKAVEAAFKRLRTTKVGRDAEN